MTVPTIQSSISIPVSSTSASVLPLPGTSPLGVDLSLPGLSGPQLSHTLGGSSLPFQLEPPRLHSRTLPPPPARPSSSSETEFRNPLGMLAEAAQSTDAVETNLWLSPQSARGEESPQDVGIASKLYFQPVQASATPSFSSFLKSAEIMKILSLEDVEKLFDIYLTHLHVHSPTVDRDHCTPELVAGRSLTLFNAICCVSGRYYKEKPRTSSQLGDFAKKILSSFPLEKSLEAVQAHILYCGYSLVPARNHQEDTQWIRVGLALRMGLDLDLHRVGTQSFRESEGANIPEWRLRSMRRTWLVCYTLDKMISCQMGKPSMMSDLDPWFATACSLDLPIDRRIFSNVELSQILAKGLTAVSLRGDDASANCSRQLEEWGEKWLIPTKWGPDTDDEQSQIRQARVKLYYNYASLLLASIDLQNALDNRPTFAPFALAKYQTSALALLDTFRVDLAAMNRAKYCTDYHFTYVLFGAISLLKSLQPQFQHSLISREGAGNLINSIAEAFEEASATWDHLPALQAKFLRRVLSARLPDYLPPNRTAPYNLSQVSSSSDTCIPNPSLTNPESLESSNQSQFERAQMGTLTLPSRSTYDAYLTGEADFSRVDEFDNLVFCDDSWATIFQPGMSDPLNWVSFGTTGASRCPSPVPFSDV